jgi:hypothetical protein
MAVSLKTVASDMAVQEVRRVEGSSQPAEDYTRVYPKVSGLNR